MPPPSPPLFLFDRLVHTYPPGFDADNIQGLVLTSGEKLAFGFHSREAANLLVRELELEAVLGGATDPSFLILRGGCLYTGINTLDKNIVLIASAFIEVHSGEVFLIYNAIDRSLHMIPSMPRTCPAFRTNRVLVARCHDNDKSYALVFPGQMFVEGNHHHDPQDVLFVSYSSSPSPWQTVKKIKIPDHLRSGSWFSAEEVFSSRGHGYWVDLLVGIMYCVCIDVMSDHSDCMNIHSLDLPVGCQKYLGCRESIAHPRAFRAMGPVGDSIKFVSIDGYLEPVDLTDCKVRVWRLMKDMHWDVEYELKLASLWEGKEFKGDFIPNWMTPMYPFLSTHEDHVIYFTLGQCKLNKGICLPSDSCCMVRVDLCNKTFHCTGLSQSQCTGMASHLAVSRNAEGKLLGLELPAIPSDS
uniref:Uncharacterized protein n=1 Tax=Avena sativa TaxID=4498 RepID=A0ACD6AM11_AVESA